MKSKSTPVYSEKINLKVILGLSFEGLHPFRGTDKLAKCTKFSTESCCTHPPLIFVGKSLIISLERIKFCICLAEVCENSVFSYFMKSSINSELFYESAPENL